MLGFHTPTFFWAFLGLLIPFMIHLWNRKRMQAIPVGSIQWLSPGKNSRVSRLQLSQLPLLLLRMVMLAVFVGLLSQPFWNTKENQAIVKKFLLVQPEVLQHEPVLETLKKQQAEGAEIHLLAEHFPEWNGEQVNANEKNGPVNVWYLLEQASVQLHLPDTVTLYTSDAKHYFVGQKPVLPFFTDWNLIPALESQWFLADAHWNKKGDSLQVYLGKATPETTDFSLRNFSKEELPLEKQLKKEGGKLTVTFDPEMQNWHVQWNEGEKVAVRQTKRIKMYSYADPAFQADLNILQAAVNVVKTFSGMSIETEDIYDLEYDRENWLFWLSNQPVPDSIARSGIHTLQFKPFSGGAAFPLIYKKGGAHYLTQRLDPKVNPGIVNGSLARALYETIFPGDHPAVLAARQHDLRPVELAMVLPVFRPELKGETANWLSLEWPLIYLLLALFIIERMISTWKRKEA